jgi:hypothetical protein
MTSKNLPSRRGSLPRRVLALLLLAALGSWAWFGGRAYAGLKRDEAARARVDAHKPKALLDLRASEDARLHGGSVPIDEAMRRLSTTGRTGLGRALAPVQSNDTAPLMGWVYQPHDVPEWMMTAPTDAGADGQSPPPH